MDSRLTTGRIDTAGRVGIDAATVAQAAREIVFGSPRRAREIIAENPSTPLARALQREIDRQAAR